MSTLSMSVKAWKPDCVAQRCLNICFMRTFTNSSEAASFQRMYSYHYWAPCLLYNSLRKHLSLYLKLKEMRVCWMSFSFLELQWMIKTCFMWFIASELYFLNGSAGLAAGWSGGLVLWLLDVFRVFCMWTATCKTCEKSFVGSSVVTAKLSSSCMSHNILHLLE